MITGFDKQLQTWILDAGLYDPIARLEEFLGLRVKRGRLRRTTAPLQRSPARRQDEVEAAAARDVAHRHFALVGARRFPGRSRARARRRSIAAAAPSAWADGCGVRAGLAAPAGVEHARCRSSSSMPPPVSMTATEARPSTHRRRHGDRRARRGVLDRVQEQVRDRARQLARIGAHDDVAAESGFDADVAPCETGRRSATVSEITSYSDTSCKRESQRSGVDLGQLEEVVDHGRQPARPARASAGGTAAGRLARSSSSASAIDMMPASGRAQVVRDPRDQLAARLLDPVLALAGLGELRARRDELVCQRA